MSLQISPMQDDDTIVTMETTHGTITIKLFPTLVPKACENFIGLIKQWYYDGLIFHRIIKDFMVQGGDPTGTWMGGKSFFGDKFEDEFSSELTHIQGALSMANAGKNTNGSQFFIVHAKSTPWLNNRHSVFWQVVEWLKIVDDIAHERVDHNDKPVGDVKIITMTVNK